MEFNLNSPHQLGTVLFEKLQLPGQKKTSKTKKYSTDVNVLKKLANYPHKIPKLALRYRSLSKLLKGQIPGPEGSIGKLLWSEPNQRMTETAIGMQGPNSQVMGGSPWSIHDGLWQFSFLRSKGNTIEAGTSEIQRNIIGERVLGLPKDMSRAKV